MLDHDSIAKTLEWPPRKDIILNGKIVTKVTQRRR